MTDLPRGSSPGAPLRDRVALVTGASRGIGRATAVRLARAGARVWVSARGEEALRALAGEIGGRAAPADVTDPHAVEELAATLTSEEGAPDVVVTAAGVFDLALVAETAVETLDRNLDVNLRGTFLVVRSLLPAMLERGTGRFVTVGSVAGRQAFPRNAAYSASKFGVRGFHEVLVEELRGTGVHATLLEPGATDTGIWDAHRPDRDPGLPDRGSMLAPAEVAEAVFFAATRPRGVGVPLLRIERG